ncbi:MULTISPECIES: DNA polymerase III subunit delta [Kamptonema]|uniref:DNA polymerase III subunit delta n=1 Tax=Kamptonema TaxID=1501433 RepID=UPI0001DACC06|nr:MULTISPECIES: DNA polymerase III subunit delta [Kamptonema]CBN55051.1 putative DNA polymerase III, delta subunit [Kamptonema sp. PCC 6506]
MISLLIGDDLHAIHKKLSAFKKNLDPAWIGFNYHRFDASALNEAVDCALTPALGTEKAKLVVVEGCNFKQFTEEALEVLNLLPQVPEKTHLVFVAPSIDKRLKVAKSLLSQAKLFEFDLIPPWRTDLIAHSIRNQALAIGLSLNSNLIDYLAVAIGSNPARAESELHKLATYSNGAHLTLKQVQALIPSTTQNSLQLAEAMKENSSKKAVYLLQELLAIGTFPLAICATLITQFRTWLWVKAAIVGGVKQDAEIARICQISNPKRVYFLRKEVAGASVTSLAAAMSLLLDLEASLKLGRKGDFMLPVILAIAQLFSSKKVKLTK